MRIQVLYFDGCPNRQVLDQRLQEALSHAGLEVTVEAVMVDTAAAAETLGFHGSPSLLMDGVDPFAEPGDPVGLACRLYRTPDGVGGSPTVAQLVEVLVTRATRGTAPVADNGADPSMPVLG